MRTNLFLMSAALVMSTCAAGQDRETAPEQTAKATPSETGRSAVRREGIGAHSTALNLTLPREAASPFRMAMPEPNQQKQAWCVQQSQVRPEGSNLFRTNERLASGCYDRGVAVSGRDLLIYSVVQLAVRQAASIFTD